MPATGRVDRDARPRERLDVAMDGALRDLELGGQLGVDADFLPHRALIAKQFFGHGPPEHDHLAALDHVLTVKGAAPAHGPVADGEILGGRTGDQGGPVRIAKNQLHPREVVLRRGRDHSRDFVLDGLRVGERNARS